MPSSSLPVQILFGGMTPTREYLRRYTGYVEQFDTLLPILTVEEMMMYTAELKRPMSESIASKRQAVEELVTALGLDVCRYKGPGRRKTILPSRLLQGANLPPNTLMTPL